ncbi:MAG: hypothetical protein TECD_00669 [Hyphomicrobiaceae bacterium hypho_1]
MINFWEFNKILLAVLTPLFVIIICQKAIHVPVKFHNIEEVNTGYKLPVN